MSEQPLVFGAGLTASELEGVAQTSDWSRWIERERAPRSGDGAGFRKTWHDDLALLADLGLTEVMITLEWARLWPTQKTPSQEEIEFRCDLLRRATDLGMTPWACIVDGTLPGWFADDERGFTDDKARRLLWPRHVDWVGETFGDLVGGWVPMREPRQWAAWGHLVGATPPGLQRRRDMQKMTAAIGQAELDAERLLRGSAPVATYVTGRGVVGERDNVKAAPHARWLGEHLSSDWLHQLADGNARDAFNRVVVQLRPPIMVDADGAWHPVPGGTTAAAVLDGLDPAIEASGDRTVVAAGDLAEQSADGASGSEYLELVFEGIRERRAIGWWQASPIDGWHWQHGLERSPGLFDRGRGARMAVNTFPGPPI